MGWGLIVSCVFSTIVLVNIELLSEYHDSWMKAISDIGPKYLAQAFGFKMHHRLAYLSLAISAPHRGLSGL